MKKIVRFSFIGLLALLLSHSIAFAQSNSSGNPVDPALISKEQKEIVKLQSRLLESREKLAGLYKDKEDYIKKREAKQSDAQRAANQNESAATKFSNNADSKRSAKKAKKAANRAASEAKSARKAASKVEKTEKRIRSLEKDIEKDEKRLEKLQQKAGV